MPATETAALTAALLLMSTTSVPATGQPSTDVALEATAETPAVYDDEPGGYADADDPAIWVNHRNTSSSVVLGTLKEGGLAAYDLSGGQLQHVAAPAAPSADTPAGRFNNVDVLPRFSRSMPGDVAIVSDRGRDTLRTYLIDRRGAAAGDKVLTDVSAPNLPLAFSVNKQAVAEQFSAYGLTTRTGRDGASYAIASRRHTPELGMFRLIWSGDKMTYQKTATITLPSDFTLSDGTSWTPCEDPGDRPQVEGMVVDRRTDTLYAAQEQVGLWRIPLKGKDFGRPTLVDKVREFGQQYTYDPVEEECALIGEPHPDGGDHLTADAEGLTIAYPWRKPARLLASSQGDDRIVEYSLHGRPQYAASYTVANSDATDGTQHSDGLAAYAGPLGRAYPHGMVVVHDGEETPTEKDREATNFKFVPLPCPSRRPNCP